MKSPRSVALIALITVLCAFQMKAQGVQQMVDSLNNVSLSIKSDYPDSSYKLAQQALAAAKQIRYEKGESDALVRIGLFHRHKARFQETLDFFHQALAIRKRLNLPKEIAGVLDNIGNVHLRLKQNDSAMYYLHESLRLREQLRDVNELAKSFVNLGNLYEQTGLPDSALKYHRLTMPIYSTRNDTAALARSMLSLGNDHRAGGNRDSAIFYYSAGLAIAEQSGKENQQADFQNNLGLIRMDAREYGQALIAFRKSRELELRAGDSSEVPATLVNIGYVFSQMGRADSAQHYLQQGLELAQRNGSKEIELQAYLHLIEFAERQGDYEKALEYFKAFNSLDQQGLEMHSVLAEMVARFNLEKKDKLILQLDTESRHKSVQNKLLIAGVTALLLIVLLLWRNARQRKRIMQKNEELHRRKVDELIHTSELRSVNAMMEGQEEERRRIAQELHDRLGSMLSTIKLHFSSLESKMEAERLRNRDQFDRTRSLLDQTVEEVRRISHNMEAGVVVKFGLEQALEDLCETINATGLIRMHVQITGLESRLPVKMEVAVYRMVQELISNVLKHARATEMTVQLIQRDSVLNVTVEDNGVGFTADTVHSGGMGLKGVTARAEALGGMIHLDSGKGNGTTVWIDIPLTGN